MKNTFDTSASEKVTQRPRDLPAPKKLIERGITTEATLAYQEQRPPPVMEPAPTPDDPPGWRNAVAQADAIHQLRMMDRRAEFEGRGVKTLRDFSDAQKVSPQERRQRGWER